MDLLSLHEDAEHNGGIAICQDDVTIIYLCHSIPDQHVICKDDFLLHIAHQLK